MNQTDILEQILYPAVEELAQSNPTWQEVTRQPDTLLMGDGSPLNSIAVVTFIVKVEARIHDVTGQSVSLASEKAFSRSRSPFRTLGSLAEYVEEVLSDTTLIVVQPSDPIESHVHA